jgi:hypothetical protein
VRSIVLLDLDGVLNPFGAPTCPDGYQEKVLFEGEEPNRYCVAHGDWIRDLAAVADVWWATAWGQHANDLYLPLLGVDPLPFVPFSHPLPFAPELKVPAVDVVAGDRPAVWIDDNHTTAGRRWAAGRTAPTLLVSIDPAVGWTRPDVDSVLAWIRRVGT